MAAQRVLVLGGYGAFGSRIAERLARDGSVEVVIAGRSLERALDLAGQLAQSVNARVQAAAMDARTVRASELQAWKPDVLINASGPYQEQDYALARACIAARIHYVDLADARVFVTGIGALDAEAQSAGVLVVSGASTVPAVSAAVLQASLARVPQPETVWIAISPGNSFDPGLATSRSILGALGQPFDVWRDGRVQRAHGWQNLRRVVMPGLGGRWVSDVSVPDYELLPRLHPSLKTVTVSAGLEVGVYHMGLWLLSWPTRAGLLTRPDRLARPLLAIKQKLKWLGSGRGGMTVEVHGCGADGHAQRCAFHLIARSGDGPLIPATPAVIVARKLLAGTLTGHGAKPCLGLFTLAEFERELSDREITAGFA